MCAAHVYRARVRTGARAYASAAPNRGSDYQDLSRRLCINDFDLMLLTSLVRNHNMLISWQLILLLTKRLLGYIDVCVCVCISHLLLATQFWTKTCGQWIIFASCFQLKGSWDSLPRSSLMRSLWSKRDQMRLSSSLSVMFFSPSTVGIIDRSKSFVMCSLFSEKRGKTHINAPTAA